MLRQRNFLARFDAPFVLENFDGEIAAGEYLVAQEEELIEGLSFSAFRQVACHIYLHAPGGVLMMAPIAPAELDLARLSALRLPDSLEEPFRRRPEGLR